MSVSGIYEIRSKIKPDRVYIGSTVNLKKRWQDHSDGLKFKRHGNPKMQMHVNKYGIDDLDYSIIIYCGRDDLLKMEQLFIDERNPYFNICRTAGSRLNCKLSEETIEKVRQANIGKKQSEETKQKRSKSLMGHAVSEKSREASRKNGKIQFPVGRKLSPEAIAKIIARTRGVKRKPHSEETKRRIGLKSKGRKYSAEARQKISEALIGNQHTKGRVMSEEEKERRRIAAPRSYPNRPSTKGKKMSEEFKQRIRESWIIRKQNKVA